MRSVHRSPSRRTALWAVGLSALLLPAGAGLAAAAADVDAAVQVAAVVRSANGSLMVQQATSGSAARGEALADRWEAEPQVLAAAVVQPVRALAADPQLAEQWGLSTLSAPQVWAAGPASSQLVAILDTGVDATHPDLAGVVVPGKDFIADGDGRTDGNGHGTHIAGIVAATAGNGLGGAGLAQGARILPVRVLDASGWGNDAVVAQGVLWAVEQGATVINLSLAGEQPSALLSTAIAHALARGVVVVAGSGNSGEKGDPVLYPAATPGVIAVGAVSRDAARPSWSSSGAHLSVVAPGTSIVSTVPGGGYEAWSGTSMASPFVAAAAAVLKHAEPGLSPAAVRTRLMTTARDLGATGVDALYGAGLLDVVAALALGRPAPAPAAVAPAVTAPAVAAPAAPVAQARKPVVTVRGSRSSGVVQKGAAVTFTARALAGTSPTAGLPVRLERKVGNGSWTLVRGGTSGRSGLLALRVRMDQTADYRFRSGAALSSALRVDVRT